MYLIFSSEEAALERADEEGKANNFAYWTEGMGTRWLTNPVPTADGMWALDVSEYDLDESEQSTVVDTYSPIEVEED
jgi:hypothetical protein|tara:strand:+ start:1028 stop:1258 length:231 start_codon:yes stop_codon:yes gene_type:complete